jgi:hypothetical protein
MKSQYLGEVSNRERGIQYAVAMEITAGKNYQQNPDG